MEPRSKDLTMPSKGLTLTSAALVKRLFTAKTPGDLRKILDRAAKEDFADERYLGDRPNNAGTVQIASNPYSALVERVTNAIDGELEMRAEENPAEEMPSSPREAATAWFGVPKTGLNDLTTDQRRALGENIRVILEDSGNKNYPTVVIEDNGIGQHPDDFPETLVSLNRSNKLRKKWLQGAYGQGGSATFRFCAFTLMIARRKPSLLDGLEDLVGWTVVWEDEGDPYEDALPVYKYLVDGDEHVPSFDPRLLPDPDWHGVRVVHVAYELPRYAQAYTQLTSGIWGMFHSALFDPVLPFVVGGRREVDVKATKSIDSTRVVVGNAARLNNPDGPAGDLEVSYASSEAFDLGKAIGGDYGRFRLNYWVVQRPEGSTAKTDPTSSYVSADSAVSMTLYGQRQDAERRAWLKTQVQLPYLTRNLIVQIDVDDLSPPAKRNLFSSTRERGVEGELRDTIYREAAALLRADGELKRLEHEERERMMAKGAEEVGDKVREKLRKFVKSFLKGKSRPKPTGAKGPGGKPPGGTRPPSPPRDTDDSHLANVPTSIAFERDPITVVQGRRTTVWVDVDAKNGYLRRHEDDLRVTFDPTLDGKVTDIAKSELLAGKSLWTLQAQEDAPLAEGEIEAILVTPSGMLSATATVKVIKPPKERKRDKGEEPETGPEIKWVTREEWDAHEFTERTVGKVNIGAEATDILVNLHQRLLDRALHSRGLSKAEVDSRKDRYLFATACGLYRQEAALKDRKGAPDSDYLLEEQERMAEAVLIAVDEKLIELDDD
jgi:hypothetical protein